MNPIAILWRKLAFLFEPTQRFFNGNFWEVFEKKFGSFENKKVVDIACGTGDLISYIEPKLYLGVDINPAYIKANKARFKSLFISFVLEDATAFAIPKEYETAFLISAVHHLSDDQIKAVSKNIKNSSIKTFIVVDGYPVGMFKGVLAWLDDFLAGGKYFRSHQEIEKLISPYMKIKETGEFKAKLSFYRYPYVIANN